MIEGELGSFLRARREAVQPEDVGLPRGEPDLGLAAVVHPEVGLVRLSSEVLLARDGLTVVVLLPADGAAQAALDRLSGRVPGALRRVSS